MGDAFVEGQRVKCVADTYGTNYIGHTGTVSRHDRMGVLVSVDDMGGATVNFMPHELELIEPPAPKVVVVKGVVERDTLGTVYVAIDGKPYMARHIDYLVAQAILPSKKYRMTLTIEEVSS